MEKEKIRNLVNYMKNYTSSPLNNWRKVLQILDVIITEVSIAVMPVLIYKFYYKFVLI